MMPTVEYAGLAVETDAEGFMLDSSQWTTEIAEEMARELGVALEEKHWQVLTFCREDAAQHGEPPGVRRISKLSGVTMKELYKLFPKGPGKLAARIAGLPKPKSCI